MKTILTFTLTLDKKGNVHAHADYELTEKQELIAIKETNRLLQELLEIEDDDNG